MYIFVQLKINLLSPKISKYKHYCKKKPDYTAFDIINYIYIVVSIQNSACLVD